MIKKITPILGVLIVLSIGLNVILVNRYNILEKTLYRLGRFISSQPKTLSKPIDLSAFRKKFLTVHYLNKNTISEIVRTSEIENKSIPNQLIMRPGIYNFQGENYALNKEGLYRFKTDKNIQAQRIVYHKDVDSLLTAISWITAHGLSDNNKKVRELSEKAMYSKLLIHCGAASNWANQVLTSLNIKSRIVAGSTLEFWNGHDDGHALIEVWREKWNKWVVYDINRHSYFKLKKGNVPLSLLEFSKSLKLDDFKIMPLSLGTSFEFSKHNGSDNKYNYDFRTEVINANPRIWYKRVMQVPLIFSEARSKMLFMNKKAKNRLEQFSDINQFVDEKEFLDIFYPSGSNNQL
jgi:hypothetical protein